MPGCTSAQAEILQKTIKPYAVACSHVHGYPQARPQSLGASETRKAAVHKALRGNESFCLTLALCMQSPLTGGEVR
jgi:hypothetical protein